MHTDGCGRCIRMAVGDTSHAGDAMYCGKYSAESTLLGRTRPDELESAHVGSNHLVVGRWTRAVATHDDHRRSRHPVWMLRSAVRTHGDDKRSSHPGWGMVRSALRRTETTRESWHPKPGMRMACGGDTRGRHKVSYHRRMMMACGDDALRQQASCAWWELSRVA
jgi:hypothetical protein